MNQTKQAGDGTGPVLSVFVLMNFAISMMNYVFGGILDQVALSMGVTVANAGLLNAMYAYGAAFGVPFTVIVLRRVERSRVIKIMLLVTALMMAAHVILHSFPLLLAVRFFNGVSANGFAVLAISTVVSLSAPERRGRSLALLITGNSLALVVGIPLSRALSSVLGWRGIFTILGVLTLLCLILLHRFLKPVTGEAEELHLRDEFRLLLNRRVLVVVTSSLIMFAGSGAFYTYMTPYFLHLFPGLESGMSLFLAAVGISCFLGNQISGILCDRLGYAKCLKMGAAAQASASLLLFILQPFQWAQILLAMLWMMTLWFCGLQFNAGITQETANRSRFLISVNSSMIQLGGAIGSSAAAAVIPLRSLTSIVPIALLCSVTVTLIQLLHAKKPALATPAVQERR